VRERHKRPPVNEGATAGLSEIKVMDAPWFWTKMKFLASKLGKMQDF
jgi:hypothetical protein